MLVKGLSLYYESISFLLVFLSNTRCRMKTQICFASVLSGRLGAISSVVWIWALVFHS